MAIDLDEVDRRFGKRLRERASAMLAENAKSHPVAVVADLGLATKIGIVSGEQAAAEPPDRLYTTVVEREVALSMCRDVPALVEWLEPAGQRPSQLVVVGMSVDECVIGTMPLAASEPQEAPPPGPDPWQEITESMQAMAMIDKHKARLAMMAGEYRARHGDEPLAGLVLAPELAPGVSVKDRAGRAVPVHTEPSGEIAFLCRREQAEALLEQRSPDLLDWLRDSAESAPECLPIVALTEHGTQASLHVPGAE